MNALYFLAIISVSGLFYSISKESKKWIIINSVLTGGVILAMTLPREYNGLGFILFLIAGWATFIYLMFPENNNEKTKYFNFLSKIIVAMVVWSIMCRVMHWPGAGLAMVFGIIPIVLLVIHILRKGIMNTDYLSPIIVFVPLGIYHFALMAENWY